MANSDRLLRSSWRKGLDLLWRVGGYTQVWGSAFQAHLSGGWPQIHSLGQRLSPVLFLYTCKHTELMRAWRGVGCYVVNRNPIPKGKTKSMLQYPVAQLESPWEPLSQSPPFPSLLPDSGLISFLCLNPPLCSMLPLRCQLPGSILRDHGPTYPLQTSSHPWLQSKFQEPLPKYSIPRPAFFLEGFDTTNLIPFGSDR